MANPTIKNCTADTWVKVATNKVSYKIMLRNKEIGA